MPLSNDPQSGSSLIATSDVHFGGSCPAAWTCSHARPYISGALTKSNVERERDARAGRPLLRNHGRLFRVWLRSRLVVRIFFGPQSCYRVAAGFPDTTYDAGAGCEAHAAPFIFVIDSFLQPYSYGYSMFHLLEAACDVAPRRDRALQSKVESRGYVLLLTRQGSGARTTHAYSKYNRRYMG